MGFIRYGLFFCLLLILVDISNPSSGLQLTYGYGEICTNTPAETIVQFQCDPTAIPGGPVDAGEMIPPGCTYLIHFKTAYACLEAPPPPGGGGIGGGWVFFIIYTVGFTLYFVIGIIFKSQRMGATGVERIPNIDFWRDLPSLVKVLLYI